MKKFFANALPLMLVAVPLVASADINSFINDKLIGFINTAIKFLIALATLLFIWGVVMYIVSGSGGDTEKTGEARRYIIFAVVGLVMIMVIWGVVRLVVESLGLTNTAPTDIIRF